MVVAVVGLLLLGSTLAALRRRVAFQADALVERQGQLEEQATELEEQASATWLGGGAAKALADTAAFLKEQGRVQEVKPDYGKYVTTKYVKEAMAQ